MEPAPVTNESTIFTVEEILDRVTPRLLPEGEDYVRKAYELAERSHEGQFRKSGEPYFSHCTQVAMLLAELVSDWPTLAAGLLHDTIEDCGVTKEELRSNFPAPVADLVDGVTKISSIHFASDREHQATNLRKMILAMARDVRVVLIKLCDRLHNMRTLEHLSPERRKIIATGTADIYAPLAGRLGMERIAHELDDLVMVHLHPQVYRSLSDHLERNRDQYTNTIGKMRGELEKSLSNVGIPAKIYGRLKHLASIYNKMLRQGLEVREVHDLIAIRVVTDNVAQCYEALGIVHSRWQPIEGKFKDYIASPKPNGYQSIHSTVIGSQGELCEIQIRTQHMHETAEQGIAAHWDYKETGSEKSAAAVEAEKVAWVRQIVDWLSDIRDPDEFMAAIKQDVYEASVFCYTPAGDVIELHKGSTILDFAYRIHSEVGSHCSGARVNHKMAPIRTKPKTGDIVEIITSKGAHPTRDWLRIATSNRARNKIRHWLKTNDRQHFLDRGRTILLQDFRAKFPGLKDKALIDQMKTIAGQLSLANAEDTFVEIGFGSLKPGQINSKFVPPDSTEAAPSAQPSAKRKRPKKAPKPGTILVEGMPGALSRLAHCCHPSPGDPIGGFVTQTRGISVHRSDCPSFDRTRKMYEETPNRFVSVEWSDGRNPRIKVSIRVIGNDRQGLLNDIMQVVANFDVVITQSNSQSNPRTNRAIFKLLLHIGTQEELNRLLTRIEEIPSVVGISRSIHSGKH